MANKRTNATEEVLRPDAPDAPANLEAGGATIQVAGLGAAAVVLGEALPMQPGGPGAGELQVAETVEQVETRPVALVDRTPPVPLDRNGRPLAVRSAVAVAAPGTAGILPLQDTVDPDTVPGLKVVTVATQVRRHGRTYVAGERVAIDFRAYSELLPIGAILTSPWESLPDHEPD